MLVQVETAVTFGSFSIADASSSSTEVMKVCSPAGSLRHRTMRPRRAALRPLSQEALEPQSIAVRGAVDPQLFCGFAGHRRAEARLAEAERGIGQQIEVKQF